ncbi:DNA-binding protein [Streptomyces sp. NPDC090045]|uniref:DNA-binding protein n=1 Tax=Streptomyces sp. NPDC090045 TaxID=3365927 RepID=UPI003804FA9E
MKRDGLPHLYYPSDIAKALGMSEWWVKEQARRRRIPFTKPGRAYRFTGEQFAEILRLFEARPAISAAAQPTRTVRPAERQPAVIKPARQTEAPLRLRARPPRRTVLLDQQRDAA